MIDKIKKYWQDSDTQFAFGLSIITLALIFAGYWIREYYNCEGDMFSYSGAIIGGSMTLIGVYLTISFQGRARKEELALQYKPILLFSDSNTTKTNGLIKYHDDDSFKWFHLEIKNLGRGEAEQIAIKIFPKDSTKEILDNCFLKSPQFYADVDMIFANERISYSIGIPQEYFSKITNDDYDTGAIVSLSSEISYLGFDKNKKLLCNMDITFIRDYGSTYYCQLSLPKYSEK